MPVVLRYKGYRFFFYADEGNPREPAHIHVRRGNCEAKFWLHPVVSVAYNKRVPVRDMSDIATVVQRHRAELESAWNDFFLS